ISYSTKIATLYGELIIPKAIVSVISNISDVETALIKAEQDFLTALGEGGATPGFGVAVFFGSLITLVIFYKKRRK
ncbi:MAG: Heimdall-CTERM domain-containing surface protein, partial [Candidatus Hodarchaeales archaeon]